MNITCVTTHTLRCAQVCAILLCSVNAGSSHATGRICKQLPQQYGPLAAALAVLRGRALSVHTIKQFVQKDGAAARSRDFKQYVQTRKVQLEALEEALAAMDPEHLRSTMADATEKAAAAAAAAATVADAAADADAADTLEDDEEAGTMFAEHEMQKLVSIERARRNPARILFDHPHLGGLVISICDADFTYFDWGTYMQQ